MKKKKVKIGIYRKISLEKQNRLKIIIDAVKKNPNIKIIELMNLTKVHSLSTVYRDIAEINNNGLALLEYNEFLREIHNLKDSSRFREYLSLLELRDVNERFEEIVDYCQNGWCEDLCLYFKLFYPNIDIQILNIDSKHHIFTCNKIYYDSLDLKGCSKISNMKNRYIRKKGNQKHNGFSVSNWDGRLPEYISNAVNEINKNKIKKD